MAADVNQLMSVSSEGLGLIKLLLVNTNNINNHSVDLDNHKSDFEPGLEPNWDSCYVCWLLPSCHMFLPRALAKQCVFQYPPLSDFSCLCYMVCSWLFFLVIYHNRYITYIGKTDDNKQIALQAKLSFYCTLLSTLYYSLKLPVKKCIITQLHAKTIPFCRKDFQNMKVNK